MAGRDYRKCDVCGGKAFYDAELGYLYKGDEECQKEIGYWEEYDKQFPNTAPTLIWPQDGGPTLHGLGDWKVICPLCAKTYEVVVRKKGEHPRQMSVREKAERHGFQIGKRTDNRIEIDSHKRYDEDLDR